MVGTVSSYNPSMGMSQTDILNGIANLDDRDVRYLARQKTYLDVNDKKHRKAQNAMYASIPVLGGIAAAVTEPGVKITRLARTSNFLRGFASWAIPFAVVAGLMRAENSNTKIRQAYKEHPLLSSLGSIAASLLALTGVYKLGGAAYKKFGHDAIRSVLPTVKKFRNALNNSEILNTISKNIAKLPSSAKQFGKTALNWAPWLVFGGILMNSMKHESVKANQYVKNYNELKNAQGQVQDYLADAEQAKEAEQEAEIEEMKAAENADPVEDAEIVEED